MTGKRRPVVGDRWQNRSNDRVALVEGVSPTDQSGSAWVDFQYEQRTPNSRSTRRQREWQTRFTTAFSLYEAAAP
jgi:hypothetical protein